MEPTPDEFDRFYAAVLADQALQDELIARLPEWLMAHQHLRPSGLIFHMSRCGSTLVSQMLAALPANIVVSEAPPIDAIVQAYRLMPNADEERYAHWLAALTCAFGHR